MEFSLSYLGTTAAAVILLVGCSATGTKSNKGGNTAYLDGEGKKRGLFRGDRSSRNSSPGRNPNINIRVDPNRARALTYSRVNTSAPYVAMTFDDGPHPVHTPRLLDILRRRNIKATFFVVGTNARRYPRIIRRMIAEGHEVGNHTVNHKYLNRMGIEQAHAEVLGCERAILDACGVRPRTLRPPGGHINSQIKIWLNKEFGYSTIMWAVDPQDWKRPGSDVVARHIVSETDSGEIILAHDIHGPTIAAMPRALDGLLANGFRFVTVSQLIAIERREVAVTSGQKENVDMISFPEPTHNTKT